MTTPPTTSKNIHQPRLESSIENTTKRRRRKNNCLTGNQRPLFSKIYLLLVTLILFASHALANEEVQQEMEGNKKDEINKIHSPPPETQKYNSNDGGDDNAQPSMKSIENASKIAAQEQRPHQPNNDRGEMEEHDNDTEDDDYDEEEEEYEEDYDVYGNEQEEEEEDEDERTWLDIFGEVAKEILTQHVIPPTNAECKWDWRSARCEPYCDCAFLPQWGDYHLGRSCRYRFDQDEMEDELIKNSIEVTIEGIEKLKGEKWDGMDMCNIPPNTKYARTVREILKTSKDVNEIIQVKAKELSRKADVKGKVMKARENMCDALLPDDEDDEFYNTGVEGEETKRKKLHRLLCDQEHQDRWVKMKVQSEMLENDFFVAGGIGRRFLN